MGIVIVFFIGLIKLWATNRHMRKVEELDAEKQARIMQMRKSGLSSNGKLRPGSEIPFGVKALEGGVEVDGIWVARMASMASRPPDRKWSSRRKVRAPPASLVEMSDLGSPSKRIRRGSRGSRRASMISRREIMEPSAQTREKLENLSLLEEERQSTELTGKGKDRLHMEAMNDEQVRSSGHKGTLGRIQRSLKRMTPSDTWQDQEKKKAENGGRVDAIEFHERAQAKKPQRFYPTSPTPTTTATTTSTPLVAPQARSQVTRQRVNNLLSAHGLKPADETPSEVQPPIQPNLDTSNQSFAVRQHNALRQQVSNESASSSADSFVTTTEDPKKSPPRSQPHLQQTGPSNEKRRLSRERPDISPRRSSLPNSQNHQARRSSSGARASLEPTIDVARATLQAAPQEAVPIARYPPNSSRSGPAPRRRSHSLNRDSGQQQQLQQNGSTPPSPTLGPGKV